MLGEKLKDRKVILASQSPRRKELLSRLGIPFDIKPIDINEQFPNSLTREEIPRYLCQLKANSLINNLLPGDLLITADTIVWQDTSLFEKPKDKSEAIDMLTRLSGNEHEVITAVCLTDLNKSFCFHEETKVWFRQLTKTEITGYIDTYQPFDKAGAYGIQELLNYDIQTSDTGKPEEIPSTEEANSLPFIQKIKGSYTNVVGLPLKAVYRELLKF